MTRVALFETPEWPACEWNPRRGLTWTGPGGTIRLAINGAWKAGMPPIRVRGNTVEAWRRPPMFASVERTQRRRTLPYALKGTPGSNSDGAQVSGSGFALDPQPSPDAAATMDANIERHPGPWLLHFDTGEPLTRDDLGWTDEYLLDQAEWWAQPPQHFGSAVAFSGADTPYDSWKRHAGSHLMRMLSPCISAWKFNRDPVARAATIMLGADVRRSFPEHKLGDFYDGQWRNELYVMLRNSRGWARGSGELGVVRWFAHCMRCVVEEAKARPADNRAKAIEWIEMAIETVANLQTPGGSFASNSSASAASEQNQPWNVVQYRHDGSAFRLLKSLERECPWWQQTFLIRALFEATKLFPPRSAQYGSARTSIQRCMRIWETCIQREESKWNASVVGLPYWLVTAGPDGTNLPIINEGIGLADTSYDSDAFWCAQQLGIEVEA